MITAIGTLLAALVALASFVVSQQFFAGSPSKDEPGGPPATDAEGNKLDGQTLSGPISILLDNTDFDTVEVPSRDPATGSTDLFYWSFEGAISAPYRMAKWTGTGKPSQSQCVTLVATHGVPDHLSFNEGDHFCLRTNQTRIAMISIKKETANGWEIEAVAWKQRLE